MISSVVLKSNNNISFIKVEINITTGQMIMYTATYNLTSEEIMNMVGNKHRATLPCKITNDVATFYIPEAWDMEAIENYTQALMDELYLNKNEIEGFKTIEQIENSFVLEVVLL